METAKKQSLYRSYHEEMKERFGGRVYKVSVDGGFTCPNRDGSKSSLGCVFCDETGSSSRTCQEGMSIREQILKNITVRRRRFRGEKFIVYFQSYTNTYASPKILKEKYDEAVFAHPDIIGLSVATRADCVDEEKIRVIAEYKKIFPYVQIEYGLQTMHDQTLEKMNRHETKDDFLKAFNLTKKWKILQCAHVILGLPGESIEMQKETADFLAKLQIDGVKIHLLVAMQHTYLEKLYLEGQWSPFSFEEAVQVVCDFLERLPPQMVIHRIGGNGHPLFLTVPKWVYTQKKEFIEKVHEELIKRNSCQGKYFLRKDF